MSKRNMWFLGIFIIALVYWVSKGTPNPTLFFSSSTAKEQWLELANKNKGSHFIINEDGEIWANDTWFKDGKLVVQLLQNDSDDDSINQIMCVVGNGMIAIPSLIEQGRWR